MNTKSDHSPISNDDLDTALETPQSKRESKKEEIDKNELPFHFVEGIIFGSY